MIIRNDLVTFEAADVAALSPRLQAALNIFTVLPEEALSNVVNQFLANAFARATLQQIAAAPDDVLAQVRVLLDTVPVRSFNTVPVKTTPPITPPLDTAST